MAGCYRRSTIIHVSSISKTYPKGRVRACKGISLTVKDGEIFGLLGPNGAGKTTLLKLLATLVRPTSGTAQVNGYDILVQERLVRRSVGLSTGRERSFYFRLTGEENLKFFGALRGLKGSRLRRQVGELLAQLDLTEMKNQKYMRYSTGMKRKLSIARALLADPEVLLLDEPTSGIDPASRRRIHRIIRNTRQQGKCVLLATQDMREADELSDRIGILRDGELIREGSAAAMKAEFETSSIIVNYVGDVPSSFVKELQCLPGVSNVAARGPSLTIRCSQPGDVLGDIVRIVDQSAKLTDVHVVEPSLEDTYLWIAGSANHD